MTRFILAAAALAAAATTAEADLVVSELSYNPSSSQGNDDDFEYVALRNVSGGVLDLNGYSIDDVTSGGSGAYTIPVSLVIPDTGYAVLGRTTEASFVSTYGSLPAGSIYFETNVLPTFNNGSSGDEVNVFDDMAALVTSVSYVDDDGADGDGDALAFDLTTGDVLGPVTPLSTLIPVVAAIPEPTAALFGTLLASGLGLTVARRQRD